MGYTIDEEIGHEEMTNITLYCLEKEEGLKTAFAVSVNKNEHICDLKEAIWEKIKNTYDIDAKNIRLWKVQVPFSDKEKLVRISYDGLSIESEAQGIELRDATDEICHHFSEPPAKHIHVVFIGNPIWCYECNKGFKTESSLEKHKTHTAIHQINSDKLRSEVESNLNEALNNLNLTD